MPIGTKTIRHLNKGHVCMYVCMYVLNLELSVVFVLKNRNPIALYFYMEHLLSAKVNKHLPSY